MNLVFIYGPPAAGKLTVAKELANRLGYRVFQNHVIVGCVADIFPFGDEKMETILKKLSVKLRLEIFEEAAKNNINLVTTYGGGSTTRFQFFKDLKEIVENNGGKIYFVQLLPKTEALFERVSSKSRKVVKIDNVDFLKKQLAEHPEYSQKFSDVEHLTIDNTGMTPQDVSKEIINHYKL